MAPTRDTGRHGNDAPKIRPQRIVRRVHSEVGLAGRVGHAIAGP